MVAMARPGGSELPTVTTVNKIREVKPGAVILITGSMAPGGRAGEPGAPLRSYEQPVLVYQRYGRGLSVAFPVQDSWNWQMNPNAPEDDQTFSRFWRQMLRWITSDVPERVVVSLPTDQVNPKNPVAIRATVADSMIFDDFREGWRGQYDFSALQNHLSRAIPTAKWVQLTGKEPIFDSFFKIDLNGPISGTSAYGTNKPTFWGVYQDNDPKKRLLLIANVDNDIGESWEYSASGFVPIAAANETYKLGINYVIYALTH